MNTEQAIEILKFIKGELGVLIYNEGQHSLTPYSINALKEVITYLEETKTP